MFDKICYISIKICSRDRNIAKNEKETDVEIQWNECDKI